MIANGDCLATSPGANWLTLDQLPPPQARLCERPAQPAEEETANCQVGVDPL